MGKVLKGVKRTIVYEDVKSYELLSSSGSKKVTSVVSRGFLVFLLLGGLGMLGGGFLLVITNFY